MIFRHDPPNARPRRSTSREAERGSGDLARERAGLRPAGRGQRCRRPPRPGQSSTLLGGGTGRPRRRPHPHQPRDRGAPRPRGGRAWPMDVLPEVQRRGIGTRLVEAGLAECRDAGHTRVVVLGHPWFYPRFGFIPATA
ncbi:MAG: GNAT family N-acetyltransferase [Armatimonadetes bacterium]|nr:GNAT family N-acetyltransferase [Armatimonadota bacterium]